MALSDGRAGVVRDVGHDGTVEVVLGAPRSFFVCIFVVFDI